LQRNAESYGLAFGTFRKSTAPAAGSSSNSDKENNPSSQKSTHVKALSPVSIRVVPLEQINEVRPALQKSARRNNTSLRRSLFTGERKANPINELICSTPIAPSRPSSRSETFFHDDPNISEIQADYGDLISPAENFVPVQSLAALENDLREQYQVDIEAQNSPKKNLNNTASSRASRGSRSSNKSKCSVVVVPMEMSEDLVLAYKSSQLRRLSVSQCNKTDMKSVEMSETPIRQSKKAQCDSVLARKLQACEMTDDDEEEPEDEIDVGGPCTQKASQNIEEFRKPDTPKDRDNQSDTSFNSSSRKVVSESVILTLKDLTRKTLVNEQSQTQNASASIAGNSQSLRVNVPKKVHAKTTNVNMEYLNSGKQNAKSKKKKESTSNRKRTLYSQEMSDDENSSSQPSTQTSTIFTSARSSVQSVQTIYENNAQTLESETEPENREQAKNDSAIFVRPKPGPLKTKLKKQKEHPVELEIIHDTPRSTRSDKQRARSYRGSYEDIVQEVARKSKQQNRNTSEESSSSGSDTKRTEQSTKRPRVRPKNSGKKVQQAEVESEDENDETNDRYEVESNGNQRASNRYNKKRQTSSSRSKSSIKSHREKPKESTKKVQQVEESSNDETDDRHEEVSSHNQGARQKSSSQTKSHNGKPQSSTRKTQQVEVESEDATDETDDHYESASSGNQGTSNDYEEPSSRYTETRQTSSSQSKSQHKKVQQNDEEEESENEERSPEVPKKSSKKGSEKTKRQQKPIKQQKRKRVDDNDSSDDDDGKRKTRRRILSTKKRSDSDEGFESNDDDFDVIYKPENDRYSLRKRRFARPYWIRNAPSNLRIQSHFMTKEDEKAEKEIDKLVRENKITRVQAIGDQLQAFMPPLDRLNLLKKKAKDNVVNKRAKSVQRGFSQPPSEAGNAGPSRRANRMNRIEEESSLTSSTTNQSTYSEAISNLFNRLKTTEGGEGNERSLQTSEFYGKEII
jgi:trimeric autotransporter adhesin